MADEHATPETDSAANFESPKTTEYREKLDPNDQHSPKFKGYNITDFLEEYNFDADRVCWDDLHRKKMVPYFCLTKYKLFVRRLPGYNDSSVSWADYQKLLCKTYAGTDENRK
jgi:hypothetical protein